MIEPQIRPELGGVPLSTRSLGIAVPQHPGTFYVNLVPTLLAQARDVSGLFLGLLTKAPRPEGHSFKEVQAPGYARQLVDLQFMPGYTALENAARVAFGPVTEAWPKARYAALFNADGEVLYFGAIFERVSAVRPTEWMEFAVDGVKVKLARQA